MSFIFLVRAWVPLVHTSRGCFVGAASTCHTPYLGYGIEAGVMAAKVWCVRPPNASAPAPPHHRRYSRRPTGSLSAGPLTLPPSSAMGNRTRSSQAAVRVSTPKVCLTLLVL